MSATPQQIGPPGKDLRNPAPRPELGVSDKGEMQNVQCWGASRNMVGNHWARPVTSFNPVTGYPPLCTFCMSPLFNTPDSDNQLIRRQIRELHCVSDKSDIQTVQSGGSPGPGLKTTGLAYLECIYEY